MKTVNMVAVDKDGRFIDVFAGRIDDTGFRPIYYGKDYPSEGVKFVDVSVPTGFVKPVLAEGKWLETATGEEVEKWEEERANELVEIDIQLAGEVESTKQQIEDLRLSQHETNMLLMQLLNGGAE